MERSSLLAELACAFAGVRRDPEQSIHQAQLCDRGMSSHPATEAEWREGGERDPHVHWSEVPGKSVDECDAALAFFTPESWRFYLPAYLCRSLFHFSAPKFEKSMLSSILFQLTLQGTNDHYKRQRYTFLTQSQRDAVLHFLQIVEQEALALIEASNSNWSIYDDVKNALQSCWQTGNQTQP